MLQETRREPIDIEKAPEILRGAYLRFMSLHPELEVTDINYGYKTGSHVLQINSVDGTAHILTTTGDGLCTYTAVDKIGRVTFDV